jgi:hypothetical protein
MTQNPEHIDTCNNLAACVRLLERLRLERDVLALNYHGRKGSAVLVLHDGANVVGVLWPETQTATEQLVTLPRYCQ